MFLVPGRIGRQIEKIGVNTPIDNSALLQFVDKVMNSSGNSSPVWIGLKVHSHQRQDKLEFLPN